MRQLSLLLLLSGMVFANITLPKSFQAHFTQKITNPKKKVIHYSGKVRFSDHSLLKWEYEEPIKKEVCTNGFELIIVDHDLEQVSNYLINRGFNLSEVLKKAQPLKGKERLFIAKHEGIEYTIQVHKNGTLRAVVYKDNLDNIVQIVFQKIKYGKGDLPAKSMQCNYPEDYDIIRG